MNSRPLKYPELYKIRESFISLLKQVCIVTVILLVPLITTGIGLSDNYVPMFLGIAVTYVFFKETRFYKERQLSKIIRGEKKDLSEVNLSGANLYEANLSGANLNVANLREDKHRTPNLQIDDLIKA